MTWELEDQLTHEAVAFNRKGAWSIGREIDPAETSRIFAHSRGSTATPREQERVLVPITRDYAKARKLLSSFVLSKVSREHGIFGIDEQGPYFIDRSTNGTTIKEGRAYRLCEKDVRHDLKDGMMLYLAANYPLCLRKRSRWRDVLTRLKRLWA